MKEFLIDYIEEILFFIALILISICHLPEILCDQTGSGK